jgi:hypothetical protein
MKREITTKQVIRDAITIVEIERKILVDSFKEADGVVRDSQAKRELGKYDRFLERAREAIK